LVLAYLVAWPDGRARVVFCDVGQGDAILASRGFNQILIDTGRSDNRVLECLGKYMAFWDKKVEVVIISHEDSDHIGGLPGVQQNYKIEELIYGVSGQGIVEQISYAKEVRQNDVIRIGDFYFEVVHPVINITGDFDDNDNSVAGVLKYKDVDFLLTGDVSEDIERFWVWRGVLDSEIDILKAAHHGSGRSTSEELLDLITPREVVFSVGKNSYGHPDKKVIERVLEVGAIVRRTDEEGSVVYVIE
jgi:competence protein ComEC